MQLDLKNVRVTYTLREVVAACAMLLGLVLHVARTEFQHDKDEEQIVQLRTDIDACRREIAINHTRASR